MSCLFFRLPSFRTLIILVQPSLFASIAGVMKLAEGGDPETLRAAEKFAEKLAAGWDARGTA